LIATTYPKRLIEVDLPIREISTRARKEKSIRQGHISTLHLWWARRPLAACRAVMFASLWPDPADPRCPPTFRVEAEATVRNLATHFLTTREGADELVVDLVKDLRGSSEVKRTSARAELDRRRATWQCFALPAPLDPLIVRSGLLAFIAWASGWEQSTLPTMLDTGRRLTQAAHEGLGGASGRTRPLVLDPFAGGGAIPLEALRAGADSFASDLNPVAVLLNRVTLEYAPKYREKLVDGVRRWGEWIGREALERLTPFYPADGDGSQPLTYIWARTVRCEGPACGAEVPLLRSLWLAKRGKKSIALRIIPDKNSRRIDFDILLSARGDQVGRGTSRGGAATCPVCDYTTPVESIRSQLLERHGGARDARLIAVITRSDGEARNYRAPTDADLAATAKAAKALARLPDIATDLPATPDGEINHLRGFFNIVLYGNKAWGDLFSPRQLLALTTLASLVRELPEAQLAPGDLGLAEAIRTTLALIVDRVAVRCTANCIWDATTECIMQIFNQGQALPARWEFAEMCPALDEGSGWSTSVDYATRVLAGC
jgi:putative DNA methylase